MTGGIQHLKTELPEKWQRRWRHLLTTAGIAALVVWAWTGWPVHGPLAGAAVLGLPYVLTPGTGRDHRIERLEALGQWFNHLAGVHQAGISLPQTIRASAKAAPGPIAPNVRALADRLRSGMEAPGAFALFADELADGVSDHVVLLFQSHAVYKGPGLSDALEAVAVTIHQQAADARDIEADRAKVRKSSRMVFIVICVVVVGCMLNDGWSGWYQSPIGQIVLAVLGGAFAWTLSGPATATHRCRTHCGGAGWPASEAARRCRGLPTTLRTEFCVVLNTADTTRLVEFQREAAAGQ
ncbi:type II secretion system F family protein [Streptomyces scopuliridis]|uniref:type II secretion system F family protein n=1 Tax=Streptomyces scopuliridis TaxID=452529 RepID=UPI00368A10A6